MYACRFIDAKRRLRATLLLGFAHAARQLIAEYLSLSLSLSLSLPHGRRSRDSVGSNKVYEGEVEARALISSNTMAPRSSLRRKRIRRTRHALLGTSLGLVRVAGAGETGIRIAEGRG